MKENLEKPKNQKEGWVEKATGLKERLRMVFRRKGINTEERIKIREKIAEFGNKLKKVYGRDEVDKYVLFHILGGSSYEKSDCESFDFSGDDSVEEFIGSLEEEQREAEAEK